MSLIDKKINDMQSTLKDYFGIDGEAEFIQFTKVKVKSDKIPMQVYKLTDSKRGEFLVCIGKEEKKKDEK